MQPTCKLFLQVRIAIYIFTCREGSKFCSKLHWKRWCFNLKWALDQSHPVSSPEWKYLLKIHYETFQKVNFQVESQCKRSCLMKVQYNRKIILNVHSKIYWDLAPKNVLPELYWEENWSFFKDSYKKLLLLKGLFKLLYIDKKTKLWPSNRSILYSYVFLFLFP